MAEKLPIKLNKEPLLDAIFEVRFSMITPASNILPGIFLASSMAKNQLSDCLPRIYPRKCGMQNLTCSMPQLCEYTGKNSFF